jgi:hypothetical protein
MADRCKLCNAKLNDADSSSCSNRAVGHKNDELPGIEYIPEKCIKWITHEVG